jgi:hypothetical protein
MTSDDLPPEMTLDDQALIEEAIHQLSDVLVCVTGGIDAETATPEECVEQAREAMADARRVLTRYMRRCRKASARSRV